MDHNEKKSSNVEYYRHCMEHSIVPIPVLSRLENQVLSLIGYQLNDGLAISIGKTLDQNSRDSGRKKVREVYLEGNMLKDSTFAIILKGLLGHTTLKKLYYANNEFGMQSLDPLLQIL